MSRPSWPTTRQDRSRSPRHRRSSRHRGQPCPSGPTTGLDRRRRRLRLCQCPQTGRAESRRPILKAPSRKPDAPPPGSASMRSRSLLHIENSKAACRNLKLQISNLKFQISNFKSQISNLKFQISRFPDFRFPYSSSPPPTLQFPHSPFHSPFPLAITLIPNHHFSSPAPTRARRATLKLRPKSLATTVDNPIPKNRGITTSHSQ